jgi:hypothetical protein
MVFKYYKTFEKTSLSDGAEYSDTWDLDEDLILKHVYITRKDGAALTASTFYMKIKDRVYTIAVVPASVLGPTVMANPQLDIAAAKGEKLAFTLKNNEGATINIFITFECWSP